MKQYNKDNIPLAKELRKNMTPWERKLWYEYLRFYPVRFQRQKAIGNYIADFYCAKARLVIELDGGGHYEPYQNRADAERTRDLNQMGVRLIRICNLDIDRNFRGVCEYIDLAVKESLPQSASQTAPSSEGALTQCVFALGFFDGVHLGHQALLRECRSLADKLNCRAGVVTFLGHPDDVIRGQTTPLINTSADRSRLLRRFGMDTVIELPFDRQLRNMSYLTFFRMLLAKYGAAGLVCGHDFRFGFRGEGNAEKLSNACREAGIPCVIVPEQKLDGITVSSTHIRRLIEVGEMEAAERFLGHRHFFTGTVVPGRRLGRTLGIPTANLVLPRGLLIPKFGVYICRAAVDGESYPAVTNVGRRPTVGGENVTVEPWILDFDGDLYGKELTLEFCKFLRAEIKFPSLADLQAEIQKNALETRKFFENN